MTNEESLHRLLGYVQQRPVPERPAQLLFTAERLRAKLAAKTPDEIQQLTETAKKAYADYIVATLVDDQHEQPWDALHSADNVRTDLRKPAKMESEVGERAEAETASERMRRLTTTNTVSVVPHGRSKRPVLHRHSERAIRMGFMLDIVGYGRRDSPAKESLQWRLARLVRLVLDEVGIPLSNTELQGTGDGVLVILPAQLDVQRALPILLRSMRTRLIHDNAAFSDQMQVRMAADVGPVAATDLGFGGAMITNMGRLLGSRPLRKWGAAHQDQALAVTVSDPLYRFVVAEGAPTLTSKQFTRVQVRAKELMATAWLWTHAGRRADR